MFIAHQDQAWLHEVDAVMARIAIHAGRDHGEARIAAPGVERREIGARQANIEQGPHRCPHGFHAVRIAALLDQDYARSAGAIGGSEDGAQVARIAALIQANPKPGIILVEICEGEVALTNGGDNGLRIVLSGNRSGEAIGHLHHPGARARRLLAKRPDIVAIGARIGNDERFNFPALRQSLLDQACAFSQEETCFVSVFFTLQSAQLLDQRIAG